MIVRRYVSRQPTIYQRPHRGGVRRRVHWLRSRRYQRQVRLSATNHDVIVISGGAVVGTLQFGPIADGTKMHPIQRHLASTAIHSRADRCGGRTLNARSVRIGADTDRDNAIWLRKLDDRMIQPPNIK